MKTKVAKALNVIYTSLVGYVEDSAGAGSREAKQIDKAYALVNSELSIDIHDVGMIASVMSHEMFDEIYKNVDGGVMRVHDLISQWSLEFHKKYEGKVNWGFDDETNHGFVKSGCWDEAIIEFTERKINA